MPCGNTALRIQNAKSLASRLLYREISPASVARVKSIFIAVSHGVGDVEACRIGGGCGIIAASFIGSNEMTREALRVAAMKASARKIWRRLVLRNAVGSDINA